MPQVCTIFDYFDRIYVINLETRNDRLVEIALEFQKIGLDVHHPKVQIYKAIKPSTLEDWPTLGTKGCYQSHLAVLKDAQAHHYERVLILEDDAHFTQYFNILCSATLSQLKQTNWDIFYGGYGLSAENEAALEIAFKQDKFVSKNLYAQPSDKEVFCLHFVALQQSVIAKMVDYFEAILHRPAGHLDGGKMHIDGAYNWFRGAHPSVNTLLAFPQLASQRSSRTDIHALKWFDVLPFLKTATSAARRLKNKVL